jgi:hypothetical protein
MHILTRQKEGAQDDNAVSRKLNVGGRKESQRQKAKAADRSVRDPLRDEDKAEARDE